MLCINPMKIDLSNYYSYLNRLRPCNQPYIRELGDVPSSKLKNKHDLTI